MTSTCVRFLTSIVVGGLLATLVPAAPTQAAGSLSFELERLGGADRYATAAKISSRFFASADTVFVATGNGFPDALAAGPAAARVDAPVLFVKRDSVPAATEAEIRRLQPRRIVVVGGPRVVSDAVRQQLATLAPEGASRVSGADRYETAAAVAGLFPATTGTAYVATGGNFPDALSGGAAAAAQGAPVLLTRPDALPESIRDQLERISPSRIVILGGTDVVSAGVESELRGLTPSVVRLGGADRYATAIAVSRDAYPSGSPNAFLTTGVAYPDALAAVPAAARQAAPILLAKPGGVPAAVGQELSRLDSDTAVLLGGEAALSAGVAKGAQRALGVCWSGNRLATGSAQTFRTIANAGAEVALTFDMGGRLDPAIDIMNFLVANQVCATIFPTGAMSRTAEGQQVLDIVAAHPELFELGNHTMHHCDLVRGGDGSPTTAPCRTGGAPTADFVRRQLTDADAVLRAATGQTSQPYWRPPYGSINQAVIDAAASVGYTKTFLWDIDTIDWRPISDGGPTARQIADKVVGNAVNGSNVLFHLGGYETLDAMRIIIPALRDRGFTLTSLSDLLDGQ